MQRLPPGGAMAAVLDNAGSVETALGRFDGRLDIAAYNGPANSVVSGSENDVARFLETYSNVEEPR